MGCPELLELCGIERTWSVHIKVMTMLDGPLSKGLGDLHWPFPEFVGHVRRRTPIEIVAIEPEGGTVVDRDAEGHSLGVIHQYGRGRTAVLGFGPERPKSHFRSIRDAAVVFNNLLRWLLPDGPRHASWPGTIPVNLPARADAWCASQPRGFMPWARLAAPAGAGNA